MTQKEKREFLIQKLMDEQPRYRDMQIPSGEAEQKTLLRSLMNVRPPPVCRRGFSGGAGRISAGGNYPERRYGYRRPCTHRAGDLPLAGERAGKPEPEMQQEKQRGRKEKSR